MGYTSLSKSLAYQRVLFALESRFHVLGAYIRTCSSYLLRYIMYLHQKGTSRKRSLSKYLTYM